MVNVIIYLKKGLKAQELVSFLLTEKLIACASIDENNTSYKIYNGKIHKEAYSVITAKSKSLLLNDIIKAVENRIDSEVLINSNPIIGSNKTLDDLIKENTMKI